MRDPVMERASLAAKRDFDLLPRSAEHRRAARAAFRTWSDCRHGEPDGARSSDHGTGPAQDITTSIPAAS